MELQIDNNSTTIIFFITKNKSILLYKKLKYIFILQYNLGQY